MGGRYGMTQTAKFIQEGRYDDAVAEATKLYARDEENPEPLVERAEAYSLLGRYLDAVADLERAIELDKEAGVLEVDTVSRAARIQCGASGPRLEAGLAEHGLTLRHYPQSFELSTLGGWIATRAGGHFATLETHIDDLVESVRAITPVGKWSSRRLPGSGAGPSTSTPRIPARNAAATRTLASPTAAGSIPVIVRYARRPNGG